VIKRIAARALVFLASALAASVLIFLVLSVLPGDPARVALGFGATDQSVAALRTEMGLDRSLPAQYISWVGGVLHGDFGRSLSSKLPIGPVLLDRFTVPAFLAGILLIAVVSMRWNLLPPNGYTVPARDVGGFVRHMILPWLALGIVQGAVLTRYVRSAVLDELGQDYLRTARSKGLRPMPALMRHGLRNAAIPVVTVLGVQLVTLMIGAVVIERVFVIPGVGSMLTDGVSNRDLTTVRGIVLVLVLFALAVSFLVDLAYTFIDPRLRAG